METKRTATIHERSRALGCSRRYLVVTSDGEFCEVEGNARNDGSIGMFSGSIWPGGLPQFFAVGRPSAQIPVSVWLRDDVVEHFRHSVASLEREFPETVPA